MGHSGCQSAVLAIKKLEPQQVSCGPMLFKVPHGWTVYNGAPNAWLVTPHSSFGEGVFFPLSIWLVQFTGGTFASLQQLKAYVAAKVAPTMHASVSRVSGTTQAIPAVLVSSSHDGHFYRDYWMLHDGIAYIFHAQGTNAYLTAHRTKVADLAATIVFDDTDIHDAYSVHYLTNYTGKLGADTTSPALTLTLTFLTLNAYGYPWLANLTAHVHGNHAVTLNSPEVVFSQTASDLTIPPATTEAGFFAVATNQFTPTLTLRADSDPEVSLIGSNQRQPGNYGSLRITYTIDGQTGTYTFPTLQRAGSPPG
ncbi:MAG: hypothetical protein QOK11_3726 [Pseudonocardiales bacterium]|nr:hypothetical protein [Pseudonocardiales bacterium]